jgi:phospholipase/carboxylesterase
MTLRQLTLGALDCSVVQGETSAAPDRGVVLCHGFGAPGDDLVPVASELLRYCPALAERTLFCFPQAPLAPAEFRPFGGRAWWPLDMARLQAAIASGEFRDLWRDAPPRLPAARDELLSLLKAISDEFALPVERIVLGGFSQGAMLATDVALHLPTSPAALLIYSGTLLNESEWARLAPARRGLPVLQSHGWNDPLLPFAAAEWLRDLLTAAGLEVTFLPFRGGHTLSPAALRETADLVANLR